jgi:hypothetical protein
VSMIPSVTGPLFIARFTLAYPRTLRGVACVSIRRTSRWSRGARYAIYSACTTLRATWTRCAGGCIHSHGSSAYCTRIIDNKNNNNNAINSPRRRELRLVRRPAAHGVHESSPFRHWGYPPSPSRLSAMPVYYIYVYIYISRVSRLFCIPRKSRPTLYYSPRRDYIAVSPAKSRTCARARALRVR